MCYRTLEHLPPPVSAPNANAVASPPPPSPPHLPPYRAGERYGEGRPVAEPVPTAGRRHRREKAVWEGGMEGGKVAAATSVPIAMAVCAAARRVFAGSERRCRSADECSAGRRCIRHVDEAADSRLIQLQLPGREAVLFLGHPMELLRDITLVDYAARRGPLPAFDDDDAGSIGGGIAGIGPDLTAAGGGGRREGPLSGRGPHDQHIQRRDRHRQRRVEPEETFWPVRCTLMLSYFVSVSAALAVLNMVPAWSLDGEFAVVAILEAMDLPQPAVNRLTAGICTVCTALLAANIAVSFWP